MLKFSASASVALSRSSSIFSWPILKETSLKASSSSLFVCFNRSYDALLQTHQGRHVLRFSLSPRHRARTVAPNHYNMIDANQGNSGNTRTNKQTQHSNVCRPSCSSTAAQVAAAIALQQLQFNNCTSTIAHCTAHLHIAQTKKQSIATHATHVPWVCFAIFSSDCTF